MNTSSLTLLCTFLYKLVQKLEIYCYCIMELLYYHVTILHLFDLTSRKIPIYISKFYFNCNASSVLSFDYMLKQGSQSRLDFGYIIEYGNLAMQSMHARLCIAGNYVLNCPIICASTL